MKAFFIGSLILICSLTFFAQSLMSQEEYNLYEEIINDGKEYVVYRETQNFEVHTIKGIKRKFRNLPKGLLQDFAAANLNSYKLEKRVKDFRFNDEPRPDYDTNKHTVFKFDLTLTISRAAFSKDDKQALVFLSYGSECCIGAFSVIYWMTKIDGKWIEKDSYIPWIH